MKMTVKVLSKTKLKKHSFVSMTETTTTSNEKILFKLRNYKCENVKKQQQNETSSSTTKDDNKYTFMERFVPTGIIRMEMDPRLLELLNSAPEFATPNKEYTAEEFGDLGYWGPLHDGPHMPKKTHVYYEGYFHACAPGSIGKNNSASSDEKTTEEENEKQQTIDIDAPVTSMNPRHGYPMDKPAAPRALRAFLFAFKKVNESWLTELFQKLDLPFLNMETAFADIAAQHHHGEEVLIRPKKHGGWHFDSPNSLLHLAVSLHGERYLHYVHDEEKKPAEQNAEKQENDDDDDVEQQQQQQQQKYKKTEDDDDETEEVYSRIKNVTGQVYLTSPSAFMHAVEYPKTTFADRILAVQCRTLLDSRNDFLESKIKIDWDSKTAIVGEYLRSDKVDIRLPTFGEVVQILGEMEKISASSTTASEGGKKCVIQ